MDASSWLNRVLLTSTNKIKDTKVLYSTILIFVTLNYLYCDLIGLMDSNLLNQFLTGTVEGMDIDAGFLFGAGILMEIPIAMVLLSRILKRQANRFANIIAGFVKTTVMIITLFIGTPTIYYLFFATFCCFCCLWAAVKKNRGIKFSSRPIMFLEKICAFHMLPTVERS